MRSLLLGLVILLYGAAASAATVVVEPPLVGIVPTVDALHHTCTAAGRFDACTTFISYHLATACSPNGARWRIDARAEFRPWIHLYNIRQLTHEQLHVDDVRVLAAQHAASLEATEFASEADCAAAALAARDTFESAMLAFARQSNAMRHPKPAGW